MRTKLTVDAVPGSENKGPGNTDVDTSRAEGGTILLRTRMWTPVEFREERATSKPVLIVDAPWKHVTSFPPNPKLNTGMRAAVRPSGSLVPIKDGEGT